MDHPIYHSLTILFLAFLLSGCDHKGSTITADELVGSYEYHHWIATRESGEVLQEQYDINRPLNLREDGYFSQVYETGTWSVADNRLTLHLFPSDSSSHQAVYTILERRDNRLKIRMTVPNGQRTWPTDNPVGADELITITQEYLTYKR